MTHGETGRQYLQHTARLRSGWTPPRHKDLSARWKRTPQEDGQTLQTRESTFDFTDGRRNADRNDAVLPLPARRASGVWKADEAQGGAPEGPWPPAPRQWESNAARRLRRHQANTVTRTPALPSGSAPGRPSSHALERSWEEGGAPCPTVGCDRGEVNVRESEVRPAQRRSAPAHMRGEENAHAAAIPSAAQEAGRAAAGAAPSSARLSVRLWLYIHAWSRAALTSAVLTAPGAGGPAMGGEAGWAGRGWGAGENSSRAASAHRDACERVRPAHAPVCARTRARMLPRAELPRPSTGRR